MSNNTGATTQISRHISVRRGFTIQACPQHSKTKRRAYQITSNGIYLGREFSVVDAENTIDEIISKAKK